MTETFDVKKPDASSFHGAALPMLPVYDAACGVLPAPSAQPAGSGLGT